MSVAGSEPTPEGSFDQRLRRDRLLVAAAIAGVRVISILCRRSRFCTCPAASQRRMARCHMARQPKGKRLAKAVRADLRVSSLQRCLLRRWLNPISRRRR